ncbi:MAG TPA: hypothetical protein VFX43_06700 [Chitinophagaceae bacterium]|nr:hypothetical protein [Chitinophagaceae bacterium]
MPSKIPERWQGFGDKTYMFIEKQAHFLLDKVHPWDKAPKLKLLTESRTGEHWIRPNAGSVAGFAFLYRFGPYDPRITGVSRESLLKGYIIPMMRYIVDTHLTGIMNTGNGKKWGNVWQSAHWAYMLAMGAWWIWDDLPVDVQQGVRKVVKFEAARFYHTEPPHNLKLDTKSEENAWNSQIFQAAMVLMPKDSHYSLWEELEKKWVISAYIRPADLKSNIRVDGIALSTFKGPNIYNDYTLENHGKVHPDYMNALTLSSQFSLVYAMQGKPVPSFISFNKKGIYEDLKWFALPDGGYDYPTGQDWPIFRSPDWLLTHMLMAAFSHDPDAPELARRVLNCIDEMQRRNVAGNVYQTDENFFPSGQTDLLFYGSLSWLSLYYMDHAPDHFTAKKGVKLFGSGKIILNRTPKAIQSLSWGSEIMFQSIVRDSDRVFDSDTRNGIGYIILKGAKRPLPVSLGQGMRLKRHKNSFEAKFSVNHGGKITAYYTIKSRKHGLFVSERLVADTAVVTQTIATSYYGVLNNKHWVFGKGKRVVYTRSGIGYTFLAGQGKAEQLNTKEIDIDGIVSFHSDKKLHASYSAGTKMVRSRITDHLVLNDIQGERTWSAGQLMSETDYEIKIK